MKNSIVITSSDPKHNAERSSFQAHGFTPLCFWNHTSSPFVSTSHILLRSSTVQEEPSTPLTLQRHLFSSLLLFILPAHTVIRCGDFRPSDRFIRVFSALDTNCDVEEKGERLVAKDFIYPFTYSTTTSHHTHVPICLTWKLPLHFLRQFSNAHSHDGLPHLKQCLSNRSVQLNSTHFDHNTKQDDNSTCHCLHTRLNTGSN